MRGGGVDRIRPLITGRIIEQSYLQKRDLLILYDLMSFEEM